MKILRLKIKDDNYESHELEVPRERYVKSKTKQMREFGYSDLTEEETDAQVDAVLEKKKFGEGLTIIGKFMEDEILSQR